METGTAVGEEVGDNSIEQITYVELSPAACHGELATDLTRDTENRDPIVERLSSSLPLWKPLDRHWRLILDEI